MAPGYKKLQNLNRSLKKNFALQKVLIILLGSTWPRLAGFKNYKTLMSIQLGKPDEGKGAVAEEGRLSCSQTASPLMIQFQFPSETSHIPLNLLLIFKACHATFLQSFLNQTRGFY